MFLSVFSDESADKDVLVRSGVLVEDRCLESARECFERASELLPARLQRDVGFHHVRQHYISGQDTHAIADFLGTGVAEAVECVFGVVFIAIRCAPPWSPLGWEAQSFSLRLLVEECLVMVPRPATVRVCHDRISGHQLHIVTQDEALDFAYRDPNRADGKWISTVAALPSVADPLLQLADVLAGSYRISLPSRHAPDRFLSTFGAPVASMHTARVRVRERKAKFP